MYKGFYAYNFTRNYNEVEHANGLTSLLKNMSKDNLNEEERKKATEEFNKFEDVLHRRDIRDARREEKRLARKSKAVRGGRP